MKFEKRRIVVQIHGTFFQHSAENAFFRASAREKENPPFSLPAANQLKIELRLTQAEMSSLENEADDDLYCLSFFPKRK